MFPYSTPGVTIDVTTLEKAISFHSDEPVTSDCVRKYDLSYLATYTPGIGSASPVRDLSAQAIDVHGATKIDVHGGPCLESPSPRRSGLAPAVRS